MVYRFGYTMSPRADRSRSRASRSWASLAAAALVLLLGQISAAVGSDPALTGRVVRSVDGDTIHVDVGGRVEKVRYIGINAPEVRHPTRGEEPGGREAAALNRRLVAGRAVRLEPDTQLRDRHGRMLAYVWVRRDGGDDLMVNAEMVRLGYAQVMTVPPNVRHAGLLLKLQTEAREAQRGLWRP